MIIDVYKTLRNLQKRLFELKGNFSKVAENKVMETQKSIIFLYFISKQVKINF